MAFQVIDANGTLKTTPAGLTDAQAAARAAMRV